MDKEIVVEAKELQPDQPSVMKNNSRKKFSEKTIEERQYFFTKIRLSVSVAIFLLLLIVSLIIVPKIVDVANTVDKAVVSATEVVDVVSDNIGSVLDAIDDADSAIKTIDDLAKSAQTSMDTLNGILEDLSTTTSLLAKITSIFK